MRFATSGMLHHLLDRCQQYQLACSFRTLPGLIISLIPRADLPLQRSFEIWSFAIVFFLKLWLAGRKWSYGKAGMTAARVSQRKTKLAGWLREGLIKLGPTFIKIGPHPKTSSAPSVAPRLACGIKSGSCQSTTAGAAAGCASLHARGAARVVLGRLL